MNHTNGIPTDTHLYATKRTPNTLLMGIDLEDGRTAFKQRGFGKSNLLLIDNKRMLILDEAGDFVLASVSKSGVNEEMRASVLKENAWTVPTVVGRLVLLRDRFNLKAFELV